MNTIIFETPCDLCVESLNEALDLIGEPSAGTVLLCSDQLTDFCKQLWNVRGGASPTVSYVPDALLPSPASWALRGRHTQVVSIMPDM